MSYWDRNANVTATVSASVRETLASRAREAGVSLSRYIGNILQESAPPTEGTGGIYCRPARMHGGSCETTIPHEIVNGLAIADRQPLAWTLSCDGALVRPVKI